MWGRKNRQHVYCHKGETLCCIMSALWQTLKKHRLKEVWLVRLVFHCSVETEVTVGHFAPRCRQTAASSQPKRHDSDCCTSFQRHTATDISCKYSLIYLNPLLSCKRWNKRNLSLCGKRRYVYSALLILFHLFNRLPESHKDVATKKLLFCNTSPETRRWTAAAFTLEEDRIKEQKPTRSTLVIL